jgi:hypothetical protein
MASAKSGSAGAPAVKKILGYETDGLSVLFFELCQLAHQAALSPGGVVLVDHTLLGSLVQGADGLQDLGSGVLCALIFNCSASITNENACSTEEVPVAQAALLVLLVSFDGGLDICQSKSSEYSLNVYGGTFYLKEGDLSSAAQSLNLTFA